MRALCRDLARICPGLRGRRQLVWSPGLKARFGVGETSDDEAAAEVDPAPPAAEVLRAWAGAGEPWRAARRRRVALVHAAETGGDLRAAEYGLTDAERWRRLGGESLIDPPD